MACQCFKQILTFILALAVVAGCTDQQEDKTSQSGNVETTKPVVYVSNYPLHYFVERLAPWADVKCPAAESGDPAYWKPVPGEVSEMQQADLIVLNGASYENWLKNVSLPHSKLIDTSAGFKDELIPLADKTTHSHGLQGEHEHSGTAFTTWLDMKLAIKHARAISTALSERWPKHETQLAQSFTALKKDLLALDEEIEKIFLHAQGGSFVFSHPVYQYFQKRYHIPGKSVHWEPDEMPGEEMWTELTALVGDLHPKWMIWEGKPLPEIVTRLKSLGIVSVVFDPCAGTPSQEDFLSIMKTNMEALRIAFGDS